MKHRELLANTFRSGDLGFSIMEGLEDILSPLCLMATNFLEAAGVNGFIVTPFNLMSTELNGLANGSSAISTVGGTAGVFNGTSFAQAIWAVVSFLSGGTMTPVAGSQLLGWFLLSNDGGTTFEKTVTNFDMPRSPDFILPFFNSAYATNDVQQGMGIVRVPWWTTKIFVMCHVTPALPSAGNLIKIAPVAIQY